MTSYFKLMNKFEHILSSASVELMKIAGVQGVGQGKTDNNEDCIVVFTNINTLDPPNKLPKIYNGYKVVVNFIGNVDAFKNST